MHLLYRFNFVVLHWNNLCIACTNCFSCITSIVGNCNKQVWQHSLPNSLQSPIQQLLDVTSLPQCCHRNLPSQRLKRYIIVGNAKCIGPSDISRVIGPADANDTILWPGYIDRVRKPTSVPHFLYYITVICRFARTLFRCRVGCARLGEHRLRLPFIWISNWVPITKLYCFYLIALTSRNSRCARSVDISHPCFLLSYITGCSSFVWSPSASIQVSFASSLTSPPLAVHPRERCQKLWYNKSRCNLCLFCKLPYPHFPTYIIAFKKSREVNVREWPLLRLLIISLVPILDHWSFYDLIVLRIPILARQKSLQEIVPCVGPNTFLHVTNFPNMTSSFGHPVYE